MGRREEKYRNVPVLFDDHDLLRALATQEARSMSKQLAYLIRMAAAKDLKDNDKA
tara:strand:+ start:235 stop:399 length:165 start_codon:yes stop_codon:yes gene_type:complete